MKIGILTFHTADNYGAVLQVYALQKVLFELGYENEVIDFDRNSQKDNTSFFCIHSGLKRFIKSCILLPYIRKRIKRAGKFNDFRRDILSLSSLKYKSEKELKHSEKQYTAYIAGSDQIWNVLKKRDFTTSYFMDFVPDNINTIAYAPSLGISQKKHLLPFSENIRRIRHISCREAGGAKILEELTGRQIPVVLDPTLLIDISNYKRLMPQNNVGERYLLYYSLNGFDKRKQNISIIQYIAQKYDLHIKYLTPEWPLHKNGEDLINIGPQEFLKLIYNATLVCATSFHGTALSIAMNKPFLVLEEKGIPDERKSSLLQQLGLEKRIVSTKEEADVLDCLELDFSAANEKLNLLKDLSLAYLKNALSNENYEK